MSNYSDMKALVVSAGQGDLNSLRRVLDALVDSNASLSDPIPVTVDFTIDVTNAARFNGRTLVWAAAQTITLAKGLPAGFGFAGVCPASGNASIASGDAAVTMNGATTTLTRAASANATGFVIFQTAADTYLMTGA